MSTEPLVPDSVGPFTSLQAVFNRAWEWSRTHGAAFDGTTHSCMYRTPDGRNACLIGCCIPDFRYTKEIEGDVYSLRGSHPDLFNDVFPYVDDDAMNDLTALQGCHDAIGNSVNYPERVTDNLRTFAQERNLTIPA